MMIASALTSPQADWLVNGLAVIAFLIGIAVGLKSLFGKRERPVLVQLEQGFVKKEEFEALKTDVHNQIKEMRSYLHTEMHDIKEGMQAASLHTSEGFTDVKELIVEQFKELDQKRSVSVAGLYRDQKEMKEKLHGEIMAVRDRTVAAETKATSNDQQIHALRGEVGALRSGRKTS